MAIEARRGCGYRKVNGLYMVSGEAGFACDRLPFYLHVCPVCGGGIKHTRGFTWVQPTGLFNGDHAKSEPCDCPAGCPACYPEEVFGEEGPAGLLWVGEKFYSIDEFRKEAAEMGISRRITNVPRNFEVGKTWVFLAHIRAVLRPSKKNKLDFEYHPGIFMAYRPTRIERLVLQSDYDTLNEALCSGVWLTAKKFQGYMKDIDKGVDLVPVPDDDKDHQ